MTTVSFPAAREILQRAVAAGAFPAAVVEAGRTRGPVWREAFGTLTYDSGAPKTSEETVFDLASLTKVMSTTTLVMRAVGRHQIALDDRVSARLAGWKGPDRDQVTVRLLLAHAAGLTAYLPFFRDYTGRPEFEHAICSLPLEYEPGTRSIYSDLGFMLLGFLLEDAAGELLGRQFQPIAAAAGGDLTFNPPDRTAPTERDPWRGRLLVGEVHDENAWALGGAAGHAGLFGTAGAVGSFARLILRAFAGDTTLVGPETLAVFARRTSVPLSSRALGWDTMLPSSSCGTLMSADAIGHTGFTGTSLWIDPRADVYVVLLTNRVHPTRDRQGILAVRPALHDAVMRAMTSS
jgi:CubicO group peptidase (beta-lactamase class C family)